MGIGIVVQCIVLALVSGAWAADGGRVAIRSDVRPEIGRLLLIWPEPVTAALAVKGDTATLRTSHPLDGDLAPATGQLAAWLIGGKRLAAGNGLELRLRADVGARLNQLHPRLIVIELFHPSQPTALASAPTIVTADRPARPWIPPLPVSRPSRMAALAAPATTPPDNVQPHGSGPERQLAPSLGAENGAPKVKVAAIRSPGGIDISFRWSGPVPAAVFQQRGVLWAVFGAMKAEVAGWRSLARPEFADWVEPETTRNAGAARLFRFKLRRAVDIAVAADSSGWTLRLSAATGAGDTAEPAISLQPDVRKAALQASATGQVVSVNEPKTGERLGLLLAAEAGVRQPHSVRLVDLELLPSAQGLVWRTLADDVQATLAADRFVLTRPGGLRLSTGTPDPAPAQPEPAVPPSGGMAEVAASVQRADPSATAPVGLAALGSSDGATRQQARHTLLADLPHLSGLPRAVARLDLAKLYLADALGPEARATLELIDPAALGAPNAVGLQDSRAALTGAAAALSGRSDTALATLLDHKLDQDSEVALWRAYAAARSARAELAQQEWARSKGALDDYPTPLRRLLGLEMAAVLLDQGDPGAALALIDRLKPLDLPGDARARLSLLEGMALARAGRPADADQAYAAASVHGDADTGIRAAYLRTSLLAERGVLPTAQAVADLTGQRTGWRGHPWETKMLRRLAELQAAEGQDDEALATLQAALPQTQDPKAKAELTAELRDRLRHALRMPGGAERAPIAALARYLTYAPRADAGDTALRTELARIAAGAGLVDTAAALLDSPAADGPSRPAYAATKLALARAMAARGDREGALARLRRPETDEATPDRAATDLAAELRAKTALASADPNAALAALGAASAASASQLRREAWALQPDWAALAASASAAVVAEKDAGPLDRDAADAAVWLGLARAEMADPDGVVRVVRKYGPRADDATTALLDLATATPSVAETTGRLLAGTGQFTQTVRAALDRLPPLAEAPVRSSAGRSAPPG